MFLRCGVTLSKVEVQTVAGYWASRCQTDKRGHFESADMTLKVRPFPGRAVPLRHSRSKTSKNLWPQQLWLQPANCRGLP